MGTNGTYYIRPAGRHILTIGRDLIKDKYAAIVELVKNAFDADSPDVQIIFKASDDRSNYSITVEDHGHGMSRDTVINKWMVPSTDDKLKRNQSPAGRIMQGRKGIGRYAASLLGNDLLLETIAENEETTVFVEWSDFENAQFLDEVEILVESKKTDQPSRTRLKITGNGELLAEWNETQLNNLKFELKKLVSPVSSSLTEGQDKDTFNICLTLENFLENHPETLTEEIKPFPLFDLYDYKIAGKISNDGKGILTYSMQKARNSLEEKIPFDYLSPTGCGELFIDIRVYDREKDAIESLIERGLKDESGNFVGKLEARQLLNNFNGIGVYRNGFRIRPLGDADFDWLRLNERRVQNPSLRIGSNQGIGYVLILSEEQSGLIEKSARDGLRENPAFENLKKVTLEVITRLEQRRFEYREKAGLSRYAIKLERELEKLFAFDGLKQGIRTVLKKIGTDAKIVDEIIQIISKEEEDKNQIAEDIRQAVAIYQGQATLGKIINVVLHEGRRPLNYFKNQIPNLNHWLTAFQKNSDINLMAKIFSKVEGIGKNAEIFVKLFSRLDPLAAAKRDKKDPLPLMETITNIFEVFGEEIKASNITVNITGPADYIFPSWLQDIYAIFTNLIDNSIYWMNEKKSAIKKITVHIATDGEKLEYIDYRDTGPGIEPSLIDSAVIFEPQFSTKINGTGLGLAIAGEAGIRNDLELKAYKTEGGAYFRLQHRKEN